MTAAAYRSADGGELSPELRMLYYIREFGTQAVMGRPYLGYGELKRMKTAEYITYIFKEREKQENVSIWATNNKDDFELLEEARRNAKELFGWE